MMTASFNVIQIHRYDYSKRRILQEYIEWRQMKKPEG